MRFKCDDEVIQWWANNDRSIKQRFDNQPNVKLLMSYEDKNVLYFLCSEYLIACTENTPWLTEATVYTWIIIHYQETAQHY